MEYHRQGCSEKRKYAVTLSSLLAVRFQKAERVKSRKFGLVWSVSHIYAKQK